MIQLNMSEQAARFNVAPAFGDLEILLTEARESLGLRHYLFLQFNNGGTDAGVLLQDYPQEWMDIQADTLDFFQSPVLHVASRQSTPFHWHDLPKIMTLSQRQAEHVAVANKYGIVDGYTIPFHAPGGPSAFFSFVTDPGEMIHHDVIGQAMYIASLGHQAANRIKSQQPAPEQPLSDNDIRVVTMLCRGRTRANIARKLEITPKEVTAAIARACRHYKAGTQTEMIVRALWNQQIRFQDIIG